MTDAVLDLLKGPPPRDRRKKCYYATWLDSQSSEAKTVVSTAMGDPRWKTVQIFNIVTQLDPPYEKMYNTLRTHRAGECSCER